MTRDEYVRFEKLVEGMDDFPDCGILLEGESMWGKRIDKDHVILNNNPLATGYHWRDVIDTRDNSVVFRYYLEKFSFRYPAGIPRIEIWTRLKPLGDPGFLVEGIAYVLLRSPEGAEEKVRRIFNNLFYIDDFRLAIPLYKKHPQFHLTDS